MSEQENGPEEDISIEIKKEYTLRFFENFSHFAFQGRGLGALISYIELLEISAEKVDGKYSIDADIFGELVASNEATKDWILNGERCTTALRAEYRTETIPGANIQAILQETLSGMETCLKIKNHSVENKLKSLDFKTKTSREALSLVLTEAITNACKFSPENSTISIYESLEGLNYNLYITNSLRVHSTLEAGIPKEKEKQVFEPFYRLTNIHDERYVKFEYGMGVGLFLCSYLMKLLNSHIGIFQAGSIKLSGNTENFGEQRIVLHISLPLSDI
jgi:signal transduction histidine kinase